MRCAFSLFFGAILYLFFVDLLLQLERLSIRFSLIKSVSYGFVSKTSWKININFKPHVME